MRLISLLSHLAVAFVAFAMASVAYGVVYQYTQQVTGTPPGPVTNANPLPMQEMTGSPSTPVTAANPLAVSSLIGAVSINAGSGIVYNAVATTTLNPPANKTLYLIAFDCRSAGASANIAVDVQLSGIANGPLHYPFTSGSAGQGAVAATGNSLIMVFPTNLPAATPTSPITVTMPALGTGDLGSACHLYGYAK